MKTITPLRRGFLLYDVRMVNYIVGIDEAGRGPLAGPVSVGLFMISGDAIQMSHTRRLFRGVKESKQLSATTRDMWFEKIKQAQKDGLCQYLVIFKSAHAIDTQGVAVVIRKSIAEGLKKLKVPQDATILLDGGLQAPPHYIQQKTIIKGDEKESVIALASICAKVLRDRHMIVLAKKYPQYGFDIHKGYGTKVHREAIKKHGPSVVHRKSFLKKLHPQLPKKTI